MTKAGTKSKARKATSTTAKAKPSAAPSASGQKNFRALAQVLERTQGTSRFDGALSEITRGMSKADQRALAKEYVRNPKGDLRSLHGTIIAARTRVARGGELDDRSPRERARQYQDAQNSGRQKPLSPAARASIQKVKSAAGWSDEARAASAEARKPAAKQKTVAQLRRDLAAANGGKPSDYNFLRTRKDVIEYGQGRVWEKSYQDHLGRTIDKVNGLKETGAASKPRKAAAAPKADVKAVAARLEKVLGTASFESTLKAETKGMKAPDVKALAKHFTKVSTRSKSDALMQIRAQSSVLLEADRHFAARGGRVASVAGLLAAPVIAAAIAYDSTKNTAMASGKDGKSATGDALKAAAGAGAGAAAVTAGIVGGFKLAAKAAPTVGRVASRAFLPLTAALAAYEVGRGAVEGFKKDGVTGALKGGAMGGADFLTFGGASYLASRPSTPDAPRQPSGRGSVGKAYLNPAAAAKAGETPKFRSAAATAVKFSGPRGFANKKIQAAAQAARKRK